MPLSDPEDRQTALVSVIGQLQCLEPPCLCRFQTAKLSAKLLAQPCVAILTSKVTCMIVPNCDWLCSTANIYAIHMTRPAELSAFSGYSQYTITTL